MLFYQDFNEQFEGYTQQEKICPFKAQSCFIRISKNNSAAKVQKKWEICKFMRNILLFMTSSLHLSTHLYLRGHRSRYARPPRSYGR